MTYHSTMKKAATVSVMAALGVVGCETQEDTEPVEDPEAEELREETGLHPAERIDDAPDTAEEMKEDASLEQEGEDPPPESAEEMRDEMGLHPDEPSDPPG